VQTTFVEEQASIKAMKLVRSAFAREILANGTVSASHKADLYFQTNELITHVFVKNGDKVSKGQKIAQQDLFKLNNALQEASDNLEKSKLELQNVLIGQGFSLKDSVRIPAEILRIAKTRSNYEQSHIRYEMAEYHLRNAVLYAPFGGMVANLFSKEKNLSNSSQPFCTVLDNGTCDIIFQILESELALVSVGDKVVVSPFSITDYKADGRVIEINPIVDTNGMIRIKADLHSSSNKLFDGMNVNVQIQKIIPNQLVIPKKAIVLRSNKKVVFTVKQGKAMWNYVTTGLENVDSFVVTNGLTTGDSIIYEGNLNLAHETPVTIIKK